jgi:DNA-binding protein YbaB
MCQEITVVDDAFFPAVEARRIAAGLREQAAAARSAVEAAQAACFTAGVARGEPAEVSAVADGTGRLRRVYVGPAALRMGPGQLGAALVEVLNMALRGVAQRAAEALREAGGPELGTAADSAGHGDAVPDPDLVERLAAEEGTGRSAGGEVTVVATGAGEITAVRVNAGAMRAGDNIRLGEQVTVAATAALEAARRPQRTLAATVGRDDAYAGEQLRAKAGVFHSRMDSLLAELDQMQSRINGLE